MNIQQLHYQTIPNRCIQQPLVNPINENYFQTVQSHIKFKPQLQYFPEPQKIPDLQDHVHIVKEENKHELLIQQNGDSLSSAFSSFSEDNSQNQDSQHNCPSKSKKLHKKLQRIGNYRKYSRITPEVKEKLIFLIARQNMSIKEASIKLKINYSSAKFIFSQYRDRKLQIIDREVEKTEISHEKIFLQKIQQSKSHINNTGVSNIVIKCSSGGKFEAESQKTYGLREIVRMYAYSPYERSEAVKLEI